MPFQPQYYVPRLLPPLNQGPMTDPKNDPYYDVGGLGAGAGESPYYPGVFPPVSTGPTYGPMSPSTPTPSQAQGPIYNSFPYVTGGGFGSTRLISGPNYAPPPGPQNPQTLTNAMFPQSRFDPRYVDALRTPQQPQPGGGGGGDRPGSYDPRIAQEWNDIKEQAEKYGFTYQKLLDYMKPGDPGSQTSLRSAYGEALSDKVWSDAMTMANMWTNDPAVNQLLWDEHSRAQDYGGRDPLEGHPQAIQFIQQAAQNLQNQNVTDAYNKYIQYKP